MNNILVAPSILSADFANLGEEINAISNAGADMIHIDVMDGHFVPNLTLGPDIVKSIRKYSKLPFDVHLMVESPSNFCDIFISSGADIITVHYEAEKHIDKLLNKIKAAGKKVGISLLPSTDPSCLRYILDYLDLILVMTVNPGFGGQNFLYNQLDKIQNIRQMIDERNRNIILSVDGGVNDKTVQAIKQAGASMVVAGSFVFACGSSEYSKRIMKLKG